MRLLVLLPLMALLGCKSAPPSRTIRVLASADQQFRQRPDWRNVIQKRFEAVTRLFEPAAGIRWEVANFTEWATDPALDPALYRRQLGGQFAGGGMISVGFSGQRRGDFVGEAVPFDPRVLVIDRTDESEEKNSARLAGLLTHIFGAWQPADSGIDETAAKALRIARDANFLNGPDGLPRAKRDELLQLWTASKADPRTHPDFVYYSTFGREVLDLGNPRQAIQPLSRAATLAPADPPSHYWLGVALAESRQLSEAAGEFRKAVELDPGYVAALNGLGGVLGFMQKWKESAETFQKAVQLRPQDSALRANAGSALARTPGGVEQGIAEIREALRLDPNNAVARKLLDAALEAKRTGQK